MKRIVGRVLLGFSILFLLPSKPSSSQQTEQKKEQKAEQKTEQKKMMPLKWVKLKGGGQVLRVWQLEPPESYPQIAVLRVSNATYLKFFEDPQAFMKFVNENQVFSKDVSIAGPWVSLSSFNPKSADPDWVLTLVHGKTSTMIVSALPQLT